MGAWAASRNRPPRRLLLRGTLALLTITACASIAFAARRDVPLPRPKPGELRSLEVAKVPLPRAKPPLPTVQQPEPKEPPPPASADVPEPELAHRDQCLNTLTAEGVTASRAGDFVASGDCVIADPVRIEEVKVEDGPVTFPAKPLLNCKFATAVTSWVKGIVAPVAVGMLLSPLKSVHTGPGFECRRRNGSAEGKLSAHATGDAIDIVGFELSGGERILVEAFDTAPKLQHDFLAALRTAGCGYFTTVLGPGSDEAHKNHLHVDILQHGKSLNYRICE